MGMLTLAPSPKTCETAPSPTIHDRDLKTSASLGPKIPDPDRATHYPTVSRVAHPSRVQSRSTQLATYQLLPQWADKTWADGIREVGAEDTILEGTLG
ncbi:hypothetical protein FS749_012156 [Ceratobasidium sp. UAMH 11750]|nr:hypothetical protein FS749_012156 [Ceratobasidium sp. UAMH 11750]